MTSFNTHDEWDDTFYNDPAWDDPKVPTLATAMHVDMGYSGDEHKDIHSCPCTHYAVQALIKFREAGFAVVPLECEVKPHSTIGLIEWWDEFTAPSGTKKVYVVDE